VKAGAAVFAARQSSRGSSPSCATSARLEYIDGQAVASIVYRRRKHVINLFVTQGAAYENHTAKLQTMQGYNIRRWTAQGLEFFAISDINGEELQEFVEKFDAALNPPKGA